MSQGLVNIEAIAAVVPAGARVLVDQASTLARTRATPRS